MLRQYRDVTTATMPSDFRTTTNGRAGGLLAKTAVTHLRSSHARRNIIIAGEPHIPQDSADSGSESSPGHIKIAQRSLLHLRTLRTLMMLPQFRRRRLAQRCNLMSEPRSPIITSKIPKL
ncbi:hypothetical protein J6590_094672 [Homalodisca vitripennis]|nr:hypothetical protein J6590_094672 [Homalodisca vitripennis]